MSPFDASSTQTEAVPAPAAEKKVKFGANLNDGADALLLTVFDGNVFGPEGKNLDTAMGGWLKSSIGVTDFTGKYGQSLDLVNPPGGKYKRIVLLGAGKEEAMTALSCENLGKLGVKLVTKDSVKSVQAVMDCNGGVRLAPEKAGALFANGMVLGAYKFDKYLGKKLPAGPAHINAVVPDAKKAEAFYAPLEAATNGTMLARDLVSEPANVLYPERYAERIKEQFKGLPVKVRVIDMAEMQKENMNAAIAVGKGSENPPCMVVLEYDGTEGAQKSPIALVGKGITFDTGGISIKPSANMAAMKMDMGGSAAVVGAMHTLATRGAKVNAVAIVALAENMPSHMATRPGDIVKSRAGITIDIDNTDAEGRLVLCDALDYIQTEYKPHTVIDLATLTGAIGVALHNVYSGMFANSDRLARRLTKAGIATGDECWRMPLNEAYGRAMQGEVADLTNSARGVGGGSCTAAAFLQKFIKPGVNWAHLDIAYTAMQGERLGTGYGVRLLDRLVADNYEIKPGAAPKAAPPAPKV